jgi:anti-sigma B factor antagonist
MKISEVVTGDVTVLKVKGSITIGEGDRTLRTTVREQIAKGHRKIVLDLHDVLTIDSSGLGELVSAYTAVTSEGGKMTLARLPQKVRDILESTQYISIFDVYNTDEDAAAALKATLEQGGLSA